MRKMLLVMLAVAGVDCAASNRTSTDSSAVVHSAKRSGIAPRLGQSATIVRSGDAFVSSHAIAPGFFAAVPRIDARIGADAGVHLALEGRPKTFLEVKPLDLVGGAGEVVADAVVFGDTVIALEPSRVEELRLLRHRVERHVARYRVELGPEVATLAMREGQIVALDRADRVAFAMEPLVAVDADGKKIAGRASLSALEGAFEIRVEFALESASFPVWIDPAWSAAGDMIGTFRIKATALPLPDGRVVVAGGYGFDEKGMSSSEVFDPATNTWSVGPTIPVALKDARAVVVGTNRYVIGCDHSGVDPVYFDGTVAPSGKFVSAGNVGGRQIDACSIAALPGGKVLLVGGTDVSTATELKTVYVWTAPTSWVATTSLPAVRKRSPATALGTEVLIAGGQSVATDLTDAMLYDSTTATWTAAGTLTEGVTDGVIASLSTSLALLVDKAGANLFDRTTKTWTHFDQPARDFAVILPFGDKWFVGAGSDALLDRETFLFDPIAKTFAAGPKLLVARGPAAGSVLPGAGILLAGGSFGSKAERLGKTPGDACTADDQCSTNHCVDGVCCSAVCDGQCEACDVVGAVGICYPVRGNPHGKRAACDAGAVDICKAAVCDGTIDPKSCAAFVHGAETTCKAPSCALASFTTSSKCDGLGVCVSPAGVSCAPFACDDSGCKTACASATDCSEGFDCRAGACIAFENTCTEDRLNSIAHSGATQACTPFLCGTDGRCLGTCAASSDCAPDHVCDTALKTCLPVAKAEGESSGCATSSKRASSPMLLLLGLLFFTRRFARKETR